MHNVAYTLNIYEVPYVPYGSDIFFFKYTYQVGQNLSKTFQ